ncbi:MAG: FAD:protein FMN transferase [Pirellulales bacterium]
MHRRSHSHAMTLPVLAVVATVWSLAVAPSLASPQQRYAYRRGEMGTYLRIVLYAADRATADRVAEKAFARAHELVAVLSSYDPQSELSRLVAASRHAAPTRPIRVSEPLWEVLDRSVALSRATDGAFDVTVGPYVRLWKRARQLRELPSARRLAEAGRSAGFHKLRLDAQQRTVTLLAPRMRIDLGAVAKGYIVDQVLSGIREEGLHRALVDAGGDLAVGAAPPGQLGWRIGLVTADEEATGPVEFVWLCDRAVATSGDTYRHVEIDGQRYSHLIDPRTGLGMTRRLLVTICAPDCMTADSLASAVSLLGIEKGLALIEGRPHLAARLIDLDAQPPRTVTSEGFPPTHRP